MKTAIVASPPVAGGDATVARRSSSIGRKEG
jgi:hypothetical protein